MPDNIIDRDKKPKKKYTLPLLRILVIMITVALLISVALLYTMTMVSNVYQQNRTDMLNYIASQTSSTNLMEASQYLTSEARAFTVTTDRLYVDRYFREINVTRRREVAKDTLSKYTTSLSLLTHMNTALMLSKKLEEREIYAMRLIVDANGYNAFTFSQRLASKTLTDADSQLSSEEKTALAQSLVYDNTYKDYVTAIEDEMTLFTKGITKELHTRQKQSAAQLATMIDIQRVLVFILVAATLIIVLLTIYMIILPLRRCSVSLLKNEHLRKKGAREIHALAEAYNQIYDRYISERQKLLYATNHDSLTDVNNRIVFEQMLKTDTNHQRVAMLIIDIDNFKNINDQNGHEAGDRVLKNVAGLFKSSFRADDYVCRIGGDEFAVILFNVTNDNRDLLINKIQSIMEICANPKDDLPRVTLSVGVAFGDEDFPIKRLYKNADTALYKVKQNGRNNMMFYGEDGFVKQ